MFIFKTYVFKSFATTLSTSSVEAQIDFKNKMAAIMGNEFPIHVTNELRSCRSAIDGT